MAGRAQLLLRSGRKISALERLEPVSLVPSIPPLNRIPNWKILLIQQTKYLPVISKGSLVGDIEIVVVVDLTVLVEVVEVFDNEGVVNTGNIDIAGDIADTELGDVKTTTEITEKMRNTNISTLSSDLTNSDTARDDHEADKENFERKMNGWSSTTVAAGTLKQIILEEA